MKKIRFQTKCTIVGKEFKKAMDEWKTQDGKTIQARPKTWNLYLLIGDKREQDENLYSGEPSIVSVQVNKETYHAITAYVETDCIVEMQGALNNRTKVLSISGLDVIVNETSVDEDEE